MSTSNVAIITGSSRGIGAETAKLFAQNGFAVCINYRQNAIAAKNIQQTIQNHGGRCIAVKADVSNPDDVAQLFDRVDAELGPISTLVNNAGILSQQCRLEDMSDERFQRVLQTNVLSCFYCCKAAIKRMSTQYGAHGGTIVNVSSAASRLGSPNEYIDYAASKGAMDTLTRGLALELADDGIRVNAVRPGLVFTDIHASGGEANRVDRLAPKIPLQRGGQPNEVAEAILWLASAKSSYVTGSFIDASGGL